MFCFDVIYGVVLHHQQAVGFKFELFAAPAAIATTSAIGVEKSCTKNIAMCILFNGKI